MTQRVYGRSIISSAKRVITNDKSANELVENENNVIQSDNTRADTFTLSGQQMVDKYTLSAEQILERCIEIDYETMENLTEDSEGNLCQWVELFNSFPDTWHMLMSDDDIVGYWHFVCLNDESFEKAKNGELLDGDITIDTIEYMFLPGDYKGYFVGIAILPNFRNVRNLQLLLNSFVEQLEVYAEHGIFFIEWCANAFTKEGKAMCKSLRMEKLCDNKLDGEMFYAEFRSMMELKVVNNSPRLVELYRTHFDTWND